MSEIDAVVRCILEAEQSSNDGKEVTPVPMPNTEVKLFSANGSWGLSPCESRTLLGTLKAQLFIQLCFFFWPILLEFPSLSYKCKIFYKNPTSFIFFYLL